MKPKTVTVHDKMQRGYRYRLTEPAGRNFDPEFKPELTPKEMLALGVFGGKYMTDCTREFPQSWFVRAKLSPKGRTRASTISASMPPRRFRTGSERAGSTRTIRAAGSSGTAATTWDGACEDDARQIKRWKKLTRHIAQLKKHCEPGDPHCRPRQRQALLHWAYDSRTM